MARAILAYVGNLDRLNLLGRAVTNIARRHVHFGMGVEYYPIVSKHLLHAMQTVLGDAVTPEVLEAWAATYGQLAEIVIRPS